MKKIAIVLLLALLGSTAHAQTFILEFDSGQGFRLPVISDSARVSFRDRLDLNGDGNPEMVLWRFDEQDNPVEIAVIDLVAGGREIWTLAFEDITRSLGLGVVGLMGFFDINGDNVKEAVFRSREALAIFTIDFTGSKHSADDPFVLPAQRAAVFNINGDGFPKMIIQNSETRSVQIWGGGTGTATEEEIEAAMLRLFQNYPNPFHNHTTIAYDVERPGPVTVTVYDLLGRRVHTLVDETQPRGNYQIVWDGRDAGGQPVASGTYFYRLRVGDALSSKQAISVR